MNQNENADHVGRRPRKTDVDHNFTISIPERIAELIDQVAMDVAIKSGESDAGLLQRHYRWNRFTFQLHYMIGGRCHD